MSEDSSKATKVYFDESGFTGNNLFNEEQPYFVYSAVAIEEQPASLIIQELREKYNLQSAELKFKSISKKHNCTDISIDIINRIKEFSCVVCFDKKYALCTKFFEYIFEPCVSEENSLFYNAGFHHYIAYNLYNELCIKSENNRLLIDFESVMKIQDKVRQANSFMQNIEQKYLNAKNYKENFKDKVCIFALKNKQRIIDELADLLGNDPIDKYTLDLSYTALFTLCAEMSSRYSSIKPIYDESKVLEEHASIFNSFVGRELKFPCFNFLSGKNEHVINLACKLSCQSSESSYSIQLADLLAGITNYAFKNNNSDLISLLLSNRIVTSAIMPQIHHSDIVVVLEKPFGEVLNRLVSNTVNRRKLIDGYIRKRLAALSYTAWHRHHNK